MTAANGWLRRLPNGKPVSALGFGCSSAWSSPHMDDAYAQHLLEALVEEGLNYFDTAPSYGAGLGESRLGAFLEGRDPSKFVISTKVGTNLRDGEVVRGFTRDQIERSFEGSLERLGIGAVDILYLHGPEASDLGADVFDFFDRLKADGRITYSGVNSFDAAVLDKVVASPIDAVMLQYNISDFRNLPQMEALSARGKIIISGTAMARSKYDLRTFLPTSRVRLWYLLRLMRHDPAALWSGVRLARRMRRMGRPLHETAIQFVIGQPMILSNLFGTSSIDHARDNVRAGHGALSSEEWSRLAGS